MRDVNSFVQDGVEYFAVTNPVNGCEGCAGRTDNTCIFMDVMCIGSSRKDNRHVVFYDPPERRTS